MSGRRKLKINVVEFVRFSLYLDTGNAPEKQVVSRDDKISPEDNVLILNNI